MPVVILVSPSMLCSITSRSVTLSLPAREMPLVFSLEIY